MPWASWRRSWQHYDFTGAAIPEALERDAFKDLFGNPILREFWRRTYTDSYQGKVDTWDYQLSFAMTMQSKLHILPAVNLISNVGCARPDATHTKGDFSVARTPLGTMKFPLRHPRSVVRCRRMERLLEDRVFMIPRTTEKIDAVLQVAIDAFNANRVAEARVLVEHILTLSPDRVDALHAQGVIAHREGDLGTAITALRRASDLAPGVWVIANNLGFALQAAGDFAGARDAFQRALQQAPDNDLIRANLVEVQRHLPTA